MCTPNPCEPGPLSPLGRPQGPPSETSKVSCNSVCNQQRLALNPRPMRPYHSGSEEGGRERGAQRALLRTPSAGVFPGLTAGEGEDLRGGLRAVGGRVPLAPALGASPHPPLSRRWSALRNAECQACVRTPRPWRRPRLASPGFGSRVRAAAGTAVRSYGGRRPSSLLYLQLKKKLEDEFPSRLDICGEGTPQVTGFFEVFVAGKLVHSKKGGDGYVDTESKFLKLVAAIKAALAQA
uniref:Selenoprotein W n=1 Tax=Bos indicus x Bos taurus TaxID=30522 RepID=A0A4W2GV65_BOBOX